VRWWLEVVAHSDLIYRAAPEASARERGWQDRQHLRPLDLELERVAVLIVEISHMTGKTRGDIYAHLEL
jgi:hypothetical protein